MTEPTAADDPQLAALRAAVESRPDDARLHFQLGERLQFASRPEEALAAFERAAELAPQVAAAHFGLAGAYFALGRWNDAVDGFRRAWDLDPDAPTANNLGNALALGDRLDEAEEAFQNALNHDAAFVPALVNLGRLSLLRGDAEAALARLTSALELAPEHPGALMFAAAARRRTGGTDEALRLYARSVAADPKNVAALVDFAELLLELKRPDEAMVHLVKAVEIEPDDARIFHGFGEANRQRGRMIEAQFCFARAADLRNQAAGEASA